MRRLPSWIACCLLSALFVAGAGCGGGGSSSGPPSRFANHYAGSFLHPSVVGVIGTVQMDVDANGNLTGSLAYNDASIPETATLSGTVASTGTATVNVVNSNSARRVAAGTFALDAGGNLDGTFTNIVGVPVTVTAITGPRLFPYVGSYTGNVFRSDTGSNEPITLTITTTGMLTGTKNANSSPTTIVGTVSREGVASLTSTNVFGTYTFPWAASFNSAGNLIIVSSDNTGAFTTMTLTKSP